ncbi:MAG: RlpA-like double-psi beta-barrel domain-containing protein [bacterium]|nr:RlpA-like double-psi beta-barrel domain-containing protein [bacterium]
MKFFSQMLKKIIFCFILIPTIIVGGFICATETSQAVNDSSYFINLDQETTVKGYVVDAFYGALKLSLMPAVLKEPTGVEVIKLDEKIDLPWQLKKISQIYQFEFKNKLAYNSGKQFSIQLSYDEPSNYYKQVFYYEKNSATWRPLPTVDCPDKSFVRALISLPYARLAVFSNPEALVVGKASWYKNKDGLFAASPDFPKKSKLRVYNTDNNKYVDVVVNDSGPDRRIHSDRVVDLDKVAFKKIAAIGSGVINVRIEPLYIAPNNNKVLGIPLTGVKSQFTISAKSAIAMNERTGEILWQKNASSTLPLASLTKLIAIKVFFDLRPSLSQVVSYSIKDEEYNYKYASKGEVARVKLNDGDTLTVEDLVYSSLVGSANNAVETLVRVSGLSREEFINRMNQSVINWGATATHFVEPTGLSPQNVSSVLDYAIITKEIYTHPIIKKASTIAEYKFTTINTKKYHRIKNTDKLINTSNLKIAGSKTGYLNEALYCLMIRVEKDSLDSLVIVTFGVSTRAKSFGETEDLAKYALKKIQNKPSQLYGLAGRSYF